MANRGGQQPGAATSASGSGGQAQRPNGATQGKICQFKLVLLGESAVGKSSLVLRFVKGQFHEYQESTIGGKEHHNILIFVQRKTSCSFIHLTQYYSCLSDSDCLLG